MTQDAGEKPAVVIIGGGFGGLEAARALRAAPVRITLIDRTNYHLFQPLLYQVATAGLSPADIAAPIRGVLGRQGNARVLMAEVTGIDTERRQVKMGDKSLPYDYLIIATGARHSYFGHEEWEQFAPGLKSLSDATAVRQDILRAFEAAELEEDPRRRTALMTFVLVGAGPTGVEMAGAIAELAHMALAHDFRKIDPKQAGILLLEGGPRILSAFPEDLAEASRNALKDLGVEVRTNAHVDHVDRDGVTVGGEVIAAKTVIWTAGVQATPVGAWLGAEVDKNRRVKVRPDLTVPNHPDVFVIGDAAYLEENGKPLPGVAQVAMQGGVYAARCIKANISGKPAPAPFHYHDKGNLATIGRSYAIAQIGKTKLRGFIAWVVWLTVHIFFLIGFRNRILVLVQWAWAYLTFQRGARLITVQSGPVGPEPERTDHHASEPTKDGSATGDPSREAAMEHRSGVR